MNDFLILGFIYSSGSLKWGRNYRLEFQTNRTEFAELLEINLKEISKTESRNFGKIISISVSGKKPLGIFFKKMKLTPPLDKEEIPISIINSEEKRIYFLRGFFEGKSSVCSSKRLIKVSGKIRQLEGIKNLLELEGIASRIYSNGNYLSLYIEGKGRCELFKKINFLSKEKRELFEQVTLYGRWKPNYSIVFKN